MNFQHVAIKAAKAGAHPGGLRGLVVYNERLCQDLMTQAVRYIEREDAYTHKHDLVDKGKAHLPDWASDTVDFFSKAEQYGRKNNNPARIIEVALPRELSETSRLALADAIRETYFSQHPHSWAIHNPTASDGGEQPHLHLIVSMRVDDGIARNPEQWFRRYNPEHPEQGGAYRYDTFDWENRRNVGAFRYGVARLTNLALELDVQAHRVYAGTLKSLWIDREAARYLSPKVYKSRDPEARRTLREELGRRYTEAEHQGKEQEYIQADWHHAKRICRYDGLTLGMAVDYERARFYQHDTTPWREQERTENREMTEARERVQAKEYQKRQQPQQGRATEKEKGLTEEELTRRLSKPLIGNKRSLIYHKPGDPNYGDVSPRQQVRFWSHADARAAGYRPAVNQHYGAGASEAMQAGSKELFSKSITKSTPAQYAQLFKGNEESRAGGGLTVKLRNGWDEQEAGREW